MVSHAGFYVTPEDWADWVRPRCPPVPPPGVADAEWLIEEALREQGVEKYFAVTSVPTPPSGSEKCKNAVMTYRLHSEKRKYIAPRARVDSNGPEVMQRLIRLKASEWRTHWHNGQSRDPPYEAEFLKPKPTKNKKHSDGTQKKGTKTKKQVDNDQTEKVDADRKSRARVRFGDEVQDEREPSGSQAS
ncbi:unnamed protein product [Rhizoctonia solani]|uniref:Uncharacterized protein n=1 Tax=Rhizoctonia solani TaxID=456999 RepID=A0A8H2XWH8_9AGAM|nr:unnamed protein product [Rhizoctonia solani]